MWKPTIKSSTTFLKLFVVSNYIATRGSKMVFV